MPVKYAAACTCTYFRYLELSPECCTSCSVANAARNRAISVSVNDSAFFRTRTINGCSSSVALVDASAIMILTSLPSEDDSLPATQNDFQAPEAGSVISSVSCGLKVAGV